MTWFREIADPHSLTRSRILGDLFQEKTDHIFARKANQQVYKSLVYFSEKPFNVNKTNPTAKRKSLQGILCFVWLINQPPPPNVPPSETAGFNSRPYLQGNPTSQVSMDVGPLSAAGWCLSPGHPVKLSHFWWVTSWGVEVGEFLWPWKWIWMFPKIDKNRGFPYKLSILGYHYFRKHPIWKKRSGFLFLGGIPILLAGLGGGWVGYICSF